MNVIIAISFVNVSMILSKFALNMFKKKDVEEKQQKGPWVLIYQLM